MKKIVKLDFSADYYYDRAVELFNDGKNERAISYYYKSLSLEPFNPWTMSEIGNCYFELGLFSDALEWYNRALAIDKSCYLAAFGIVQVMASMGKFSTAERFIPLCAKDDLAGYLESCDFLDNAIIKEERDSLFKLVELDKGIKLLEEAMRDLQIGDSEQAMIKLRVVEKESKAYCEAMFLLALILYERAALDEALKVSEQMLENCPKEVKTHIIRLAVCDRLNIVEEKRRAAERLEKLKPSDFAEAIEVAFCLCDIGMQDIALKFLRHAVGMQPYHRSASLLYALCCHNLGMHDECHSAFVRLREIYPEDGVIAYYARYTLLNKDEEISLVSDLRGRATSAFVADFLNEAESLGSLEALEDKYDKDDAFYDRMMAFFASDASDAIKIVVRMLSISKRLRPIFKEMLVRPNATISIKIECLTWLMVYDRRREYALLDSDGAVVFFKTPTINEPNETVKSVFCRAYAVLKILGIDIDRRLKSAFNKMKEIAPLMMANDDYACKNAVWLCSVVLGNDAAEKIIKILGIKKDGYDEVREYWEKIKI